MADLDLELEEKFNPSTNEIDFLTEKINTESRALNIPGDAYPFGIFLKKRNTTSASSSEAEAEIVGGCNGSIVYGSIYTDQLWVHPDYRGKGLGKMLMEKVHQLGKRKQCTLATVGTMSFQGAQKFYESLGYQVEFVRDGYVNGATMIYLKKYL
ncbi:unnamed protein product [Orchesella dallaii]|uniref:N-acetyltransferase domain-containing protein n=1 Tax=Orchesella dallaii TaxID=48710 RepID=A0ABP1R880_9HEXA